MNSNTLSVIPRIRLQTKAGISTKGKIVKNNLIETECSKIVKHLNLKGVVCIQMKEDERGNPKFVEITIAGDLLESRIFQKEMNDLVRNTETGLELLKFIIGELLDGML